MKLYEIASVFGMIFSKMIKKKKNRWIFGAWFGNAVSDNSKAFYDYIDHHYPDIEKIWIANDPEKVDLPGGLVVRRNSLKSLKYILTAQVAVSNQGFGDFAAINLLGGCYKVQLWHGVAWKKIVQDALPKKNVFYRKVFNFINRYDLYISPSEAYKQVVKSAFGTREENILLCGQPRNEVLFDEKFCCSAKKYIEEKIGVSNKRLIVYMPTFRDKTEESFSFLNEEIYEQLKVLAEAEQFVIIEKAHYKAAKKTNSSAISQSVVFNLPQEDAAVLLGAADMLITDYSSCFFDFLIRNKPIIHYVYDYEYYKNRDRGLYYDISEVAAGTIAYKPEELLKAISDNLQKDFGKEQRELIRQRFINFERPNNSEIIMKQIVKMIYKKG